MSLNIGSVIIGTVSTEVLSKDTKRRFFSIQNIGNQDAFLAIGMAAETDKGEMIKKNDGEITLARTTTLAEIFESSINAIVKQGSTTIIFQEG